MNQKRPAQISCSTCMALCCRLEVQLIDDSDDQVPERFTEVVEGQYIAMKRGKDGWCLALDRSTMLCSIYQKRPYLCREYAEGDFDCIEERKKLPLYRSSHLF